MEDANISVQKFTLATDINISSPPLKISDDLLLTCFQVSHFIYWKFYDTWWSVYFRSGRMSVAVLHNTEFIDLMNLFPSNDFNEVSNRQFVAQ